MAHQFTGTLTLQSVNEEYLDNLHCRSGIVSELFFKVCFEETICDNEFIIKYVIDGQRMNIK